jgi:Uma2 family endonuclease
MASTINPATVQLEDYLSACYKHDRDFVNGELQERNLGEREHSELQLAVLLWFVRHSAEWKVVALPEMRVQISEGNFRVADVAIVSTDAPRERVLFTPPLIVIEILSPEDRVQRYGERLDDFRAMDVPHIWVIDPTEQIGFDCSSGSWIRCTRFAIENSGIYLSIPELLRSV